MEKAMDIQAEELMQLYEDLTILISQLNEDAPQIRKMYSTLEQSITKQEAITINATKEIESASALSIAKIRKEAKMMLDEAAQHLADAEAIAKKCESAIKKIEVVTANVQSVAAYQSSVEARLAQLEDRIQRMDGNDQTNHSTKESTISALHTNANSLVDYFSQNGFNVIDKRDYGGALWVVGTEDELRPYIEHVTKYFGVTGQFASGNATRGKPAWWTKSKK